VQIGRFSRLTGLTVKALRHYDEIGLLRPAGVDAETGYRSYEPEQAERAEAIRMLRRLEVPLDDIARLLDLPGKLGMDGAEVYPAFLRGEIGAIREAAEAVRDDAAAARSAARSDLRED
jgi:DNA-binding transcriptional MerR regulator